MLTIMMNIMIIQSIKTIILITIVMIGRIVLLYVLRLQSTSTPRGRAATSSPCLRTADRKGGRPSRGRSSPSLRSVIHNLKPRVPKHQIVKATSAYGHPPSWRTGWP